MRTSGTARWIGAAAALLCLTSWLAAQDAPPRVRPDWAAWIRAHHHPLATLDAASPDDSDLAFLGSALAGRRIVALGESGHGMAEFTAGKARLVRYLHEELGFDVLAFESSLFEAWAADRDAAGRAAETTLRDSLFGVWHTREMLELFEYVRSTKATARPLVLAGFDVQVSSARGAAARPGVLRDAIARLDPVYAAEVERRDRELLARYEDAAWLAENAAGLRTFYANLAWWLGARGPALAAALPESPELPAVLRRTALSMDAFILERTRGGAARTSAREAGMAANVAALAREIYPGRRILLWGHNAHLGRTAADGSDVATLGARLAEDFGPAYYSVGLFAGRGEACWNDRTAYALTRPRDNGLEAVMMAAGAGALFVDLAGAAPSRLASWMAVPIPVKDWGFRDATIVPRDRFDAVLFIRDVRRPDYLDVEGPDGGEAEEAGNPDLRFVVDR